MNALPISEADLHAYADGQLAPDRLPSVEAALARDPSLAARVAQIRKQSAALHDAFDPWLSEPVPARLMAAAAPRPAVRFLQRYYPSLAAAAMLVAGLSIGWFGRDLALERAGTPTTFARQVALTHVLYTAEQRRPVEVWANEEKNLVTWLTRRLGHTAHAPNLTEAGYSLVGGRLVAGNAKPTALLMYENADKQRLTLQWRMEKTDTQETAFRYAVENGVGVFYWIDDECAYALSGTVDRTRLLALARMVYGQIAADTAGK